MVEKNNLIAVIDDEENILQFLSQALESKGYRVSVFQDPTEALGAFREERPALVITDIMMPTMLGTEVLKKIKEFDPEVNVILITAHADLDTAISGIRGGASDYLIKPFKVEELYTVVQKAFSSKRILVHENQRLEQEIREKYHCKNLIGSSPKMIEVYHLIEKVSESDSTVLIRGESGVGKELVARAVHYNSKRRQEPFVSINCAALPDQLLESELFGHEKGSFTGAVSTKIGLLELAEGGTFFLDEVGELSTNVQVKLLRVLQEREIRRVGGLKDIKVNIRILAATSKNLEGEVKKGNFREDFYYRLDVVPIHIPPLRDRTVDILPLVFYFLGFYAKRLGLNKKIRLTNNAIDYLKVYHWPGNIRELENVVERILMLSEAEEIDQAEVVKAIGRELRPKAQEAPSPSLIFTEEGASSDNNTVDLKGEMERFERELILKVLAITKGNKNQAAKRLKISRQSLQYKLRRFEIEGHEAS